MNTYTFLSLRDGDDGRLESVDFLSVDSQGNVREEGSLKVSRDDADVRRLQDMFSDPDAVILHFCCPQEQYRIYDALESCGKSPFSYVAYDVQALVSIYGEGANHRIGWNYLRRKYLGSEGEDSTPTSQQLLDICLKLAELRGESFETLFSDEVLRNVSYRSDDSYDDMSELERRKGERALFLRNLDWDSISRFVFFDLECSNCIHGEGKICEFGYLITDRDLQEINKGEMIINPGRGSRNDFHLKDKNGNIELHLRYEANNYWRYRVAPELDRFIPLIDSILNRDDTLIFGFAVGNDLRYLYYGYDRYFGKTDIPPRNFAAIDVQSMYMKENNTRSAMSLDSAVAEFGKPEPAGEFHQAMFDAIATAEALKNLMDHTGKGVKELIETTGESCIQITDQVWDTFNPLRFDSYQVQAAKEEKIHIRERESAEAKDSADAETPDPK